MRVLWISNIPFGPLCELAGQGNALSGSWLDAAFNLLENERELELTIITVSRVKEVKMKKVGNHTFYILPGGNPGKYDSSSLKNKKIWEKIKAECRPDLIQIWGTEYTHGYLALKVMKGIPSVIYMQGMMSQIARHFLSGISDKDLFCSITVRDILKMDWIKRQQAKLYRRLFFEAEMIQIAGNVIVESEWCESNCKAIAPNCKTYKSKLIIKEEFFNWEWKADYMKPYTIFSNAAGSPIKGLHILLKALKLVIQKYPEARLFVPGMKPPYNQPFIERIKINGYTKFLKSTIKKLQLRDHIHFLGQLTSAQMAEQMAFSNVFVMPSSIENHSTTLIEAMIVGAPCITSYAGGIPEYLINNVNGLTYRFEEHEILAAHIIKLFSDITLAAKMASNGRITTRDSRNANNLKTELIEIYHKVLTF